MKKLTIILLTLFALTLTACGASDSAAPATVFQTGSAAGSLSGSTLLLLGTLKLDGTDQAITPQQAKDLLPLWQVYQEISASDSAAQTEVDALVKQIEETMTPEQITAITAMNLTQQDSFAIMQEMGIGMGQRSSSSSTQNNGNFMPGSEMGAGGGAPPDMGGVPGQMPGGQDISPEQIATAQAARAEQGTGNFMLPNLVNALIQYLQKLAGS